MDYYCHAHSDVGDPEDAIHMSCENDRIAVDRAAALVFREYGGSPGSTPLSWLRGLWFPMPDSAVGEDVAVGASPLHLAAFELLLVQRRVRAVFAQQGAMGTGFHHAPGVDHVDDVGVDDGGQAVGDGDGGSGSHEGIEGVLDLAFAGRVECRGRLVQDQDARVV